MLGDKGDVGEKGGVEEKGDVGGEEGYRVEWGCRGRRGM
jgi:hypothetical protein